MARIGLKPYREQINTQIIDLLNAGTCYLDAYSSVNEKIPMSKRSFDRFWTTAQDAHKENALKVRDQLLQRTNKRTVKRLKKAVVTKDRVITECLIILDNKNTTDKNKIDVLRLICDIEGYKAPTNNNHTIINPMPIFSDNPLAGDTIDITHTEIH